MVSREGRLYAVWAARWLRAILALSTLLASSLLEPGAAHSQTAAPELVAPEIVGSARRDAPMSLSAKLESALGQGSFVADEYARNTLFAWAASFAAAYYPLRGLTLSTFVKLVQELTSSELDSHRQQLFVSDVQLRARQALGTIPAIDTRAAIEARLYLPTSLVSRYETLVAGTQLRFALNRELGPFSLGFLGLFRKNFHRYQSPVVDGDGDMPPVFVRTGGAEDLRGPSVAIGGNNVSFSMYGLLGLSYAPIEELVLSIYYGLARAYTYNRYERDELTSQNARTGRGKRDTSSAGFEVAYRLDQRFTFSLGVMTAASPKSEDNGSFRFPFYDLESTASNLTLFYLDVTMTQLLGG